MQVFLQPPRQSHAPLVMPEDKAVYRLKEQIYADDQLYEAGEIITWDDVPNLAMEPLNKLAREMFTIFIEELDKAGQEVAAKTGKKYKSLADAFRNATDLAKQEGRRVESVNSPATAPIMGAKIKNRGSKIQPGRSSPIIELSNKRSLETHGAVNEAFLGNKDGKEKE